MSINLDRRRARARLSLEGLSVGDAFGECFFGDRAEVLARIRARSVPRAPWRYTDDTEMALSIVEQLDELGGIEQDDLARRFARRMDVSRGYGLGAWKILQAIGGGQHWRAASGNVFHGMGSFGNGAAMRAAPIGAYFADDELKRVVDEATRSAEITHAHPEGIAGAIAVSVAASLCASSDALDAQTFLKRTLSAVPRGYTHDGIADAARLLAECGASEAARNLGNGSAVTAPDTVPFCLWIVSRHLTGTFEDAMWTTVGELGDRDTTCAIVGGILALRSGMDGIPHEWRLAREELRI